MRIIGGTASGRRLVAPARGTRPTSDRVREALFSSLDSMCGGWHGLRVLDLYAGSGSLGLEALSRGADEAVLVDDDRSARESIQANIQSLGLAGASVLGGDVREVVGRPSQRAFDVAFLDPPYAVDIDVVRDVLDRMAAGGWLAADAVVVVERDARDPVEPWPDDRWQAIRRRAYGDTSLWYGRYLGNHADGS